MSDSFLLRFVNAQAAVYRQVVAELLRNAPMRHLMAGAARGLAGIDAAKRVAEEIEASCNRK